LWFIFDRNVSMARKKSSVTESLVLLPWWLSALTAGIVFFGGTILQAIATREQPAFAPTIGLLRIAVALLLLLIALKSFVRSFTTIRNLETQSSIASLKQLHWKEFENLMGEVFRREGYVVEEKLGGGPDGGVDLVLSQNGRRTLVQCKLRSRSSVGLPVVRELYGAMAAERVYSGILVTTSTYTSEVHKFAADKPIRLIDGPELLSLVKSVQRSSGRETAGSDLPGATKNPTCPACGSLMVLRTARKGPNAGNEFWGCSTYPKCRKIINR
jgi:restriction system protein